MFIGVHGGAAPRQLQCGQEVHGNLPPPKGSGRNPPGNAPRPPQPQWDLALKIVNVTPKSTGRAV